MVPGVRQDENADWLSTRHDAVLIVFGRAISR
jgi:hypothetical protein